MTYSELDAYVEALDDIEAEAKAAKRQQQQRR
jgi:glycine cleavage system protein P-like pyridoxal-binding family